MVVEILLDETVEIDLVNAADLGANAVARLIEPDAARKRVRDLARGGIISRCILYLVVSASFIRIRVPKKHKRDNQQG